MTKRQRLSALIAAFSILVIASGFLYLKSGGSTPIAVGDAVRKFREQTITTAATPAPVQIAKSPQAAARVQPIIGRNAGTTTDIPIRPDPPAGVYRYATTGYDEVDVLGGSRHNYPSTTTVTVRHSGCGLVERWDVLQQRWDERETCRTDKGDLLHRFTAYHDFFRHVDQRTYDCTGYAFPKGAEPGDSWGGRCVSGKSIADQTAHAIGFENVNVGGKLVRALHVRVDTKLSGEQQGTSYHEVWGALDTGLSLRERGGVTSTSKQPVFGNTRYHEVFEIRLLSLQPKT